MLSMLLVMKNIEVARWPWIPLVLKLVIHAYLHLCVSCVVCSVASLSALLVTMTMYHSNRGVRYAHVLDFSCLFSFLVCSHLEGDAAARDIDTAMKLGAGE